MRGLVEGVGLDLLDHVGLDRVDLGLQFVDGLRRCAAVRAALVISSSRSSACSRRTRSSALL